jgi:hypothetical protein
MTNEPTPNPSEKSQTHFLLRIFRSRVLYIFLCLFAIYIPYFMYFPPLNLEWPLWLTIFSYMPVYFLLGFVGGGLYYVTVWALERKKNKKVEKPVTEASRLPIIIVDRSLSLEKREGFDDIDLGPPVVLPSTVL